MNAIIRLILGIVLGASTLSIASAEVKLEKFNIKELEKLNSSFSLKDRLRFVNTFNYNGQDDSYMSLVALEAMRRGFDIIACYQVIGSKADKIYLYHIIAYDDNGKYNLLKVIVVEQKESFIFKVEEITESDAAGYLVLAKNPNAKGEDVLDAVVSAQKVQEQQSKK